MTPDDYVKAIETALAMRPTPGTWLRDTNSGTRCDVRAENGRKVAASWGLSTSRAAMRNSLAYRAECDANARLIAACHPEALRALLDERKVMQQGISAVAMRLAQDSSYRHRASEDLLRLLPGLTTTAVTQPETGKE